MNLKSLRKPTHHPLKPVFKNYSRGQIAKQLGIKNTYLGNILNGHYQPGDDLEKRMQELAVQILEAEKLEKTV